MISIGLVCGPQDSVFETCCERLMKIFEHERGQYSDQPLLNVIFHSPLMLTDPGFTGQTIGRFSKKKRAIVIGVAVPPNVVEMDQKEVVTYIRNELHTAADLGMKTLKEH